MKLYSMLRMCAQVFDWSETNQTSYFGAWRLFLSTEKNFHSFIVSWPWLFLPCGQIYFNSHLGFDWSFGVLRRFQLFFIYKRFPVFKYYWSFVSWHQPVSRNANPKHWVSRRAAITSSFKVFSMTRSGIEPATSRTQGGRPTTTQNQYFPANICNQV